MRLAKLLAFCALGYLIYEFYQGLMYGSEESWRSREAGSRDLHRALNEDPGRTAVTGPIGRGTIARTQDVSGTSSSHIVGRGVVRR